MALTIAACSCSCSAPSKTISAVIDMRNPEAVIRGYFDAWKRGDWAGQDSLMVKLYRGMVPEPVESLRVLELRLINNSTLRCLYYVAFEIKVKGHGVSMESGRYDWSYELKWDESRKAWLISNYGAG